VVEGLVDPRALYNENFTIPVQPFPGLQSNFEIRPNCGEDNYVGTGRLVGRRALITGGDSGIGRAVAIAYAREGADVVINYLPEEESDAEDVVSVITSSTSSQISTIPGDLRNESFCVDLVNRAAELLGGIDILVSNAGYSNITHDIRDLSNEQFDRTIDTNIYANFWLSKAARPFLEPGSSIIFTASGIVQNPPGRLIDYAATKGFVTTFSRALAAQLAPFGIRVNAVAPLLTLTNFLSTQGMTTEIMRETISRQAPFGRIGQPVELAPLFVGLAENAATMVSGGTWSAGGGLG
jgi:NAD(P)-dependent dehydrogenase (short-subunit alcohol dehydrogenase family)